MTTSRDERLDHVRLHLDSLFTKWADRHSVSTTSMRQDPRVLEAESLLTDVLGAGRDDGDDHIDDLTFVEEKEES